MRIPEFLRSVRRKIVDRRTTENNTPTVVNDESAIVERATDPVIIARDDPQFTYVGQAALYIPVLAVPCGVA